MGNLSSTPSSTTTNTDGEQYDVFISFRGEDTRKGFTSHLYQALHEKQIKTFIDNQLKRGEEISEGLLSAIGGSKISVIIFSENYASSKWCLRELAEIMKYREMNNQIVIPVFYEVDPSHVRRQKGSYKAAFAKHENEGLVSFCFLLLFSSLAAVFSCFFFGWLRLCLLFLFFWAGVLGTLSLYPVFCCCLWASLPPIIYMAAQKKEDEVIKWRDALTRASSISGWDSSVARNESEFVYNIVRDVWNKLYNISPSCDFPGLVGIYKHIERVVSLLCLRVPDFRIIGICGMGGIGKTTVADAIFQLVSHQFENPHFAPCVRAESEKNSSGLISLRDKIISKVLNDNNLQLGSPSINPLIKRRLNQKKVLIVLDDVDESTNFGILTGGLDRFGPGSRIILTTRDKQVLRNCRVEDHNMYEVEELNDDEALQLFYNCACMQNHPEDLKVLSRKVVKVAKNLPLAVIVLGSSLYKKSKQDWENAVDKFQRNVHHRVLDVLKISYNGLDEEEKGLFLDIACFPLFQWLHGLRPILLSDRELSLSALIDKSLVTMENGKIIMHDLLREMGWEIASKNHSRLWRQEDIIRTLKHNDGIANKVQGISLYVDYWEFVLPLRDTHLISQAIEKMYNLRTLIINIPCSIGDLYYLPDGLRYLHWFSYPMKELPLSFNPMNLVELDLSFSKIKRLWKLKTYVPKLKLLKLSFCENLIRIPDLSDFPSAERIDLKSCSSLIEIYSSRECPKLKQLDLSFCKKLIRIPDLSDIPSAKSIDLKSCSSLTEIHSSRGCPKLKQLDLSCCENLIRIPDLSDIPSAESIDLQSCSSLLEIHSSRECPKNLHSLQLSVCRRLSSFPSNIHIEGSEFSLSDCISLTKFPHISGNIKYLDLSGSGVEEVPSTIESLSKLKSLDMSKCRRLKRISKRICKLKSLDRLDLCGCCKLESFPDITEEMELKDLDLRGTAIKELPPSIGKLNRLEELDLSETAIEELPPSIGNLNRLEELDLSETAIEELPPSIGNLNRLDELDFTGCKNLERLPKSIKKLSKLDSLKLNDCGMLRTLPELPSSLRHLEAKNCKQLIQSLPDESEFEQAINGKQLIQSLPDSPLYFNFINCLKMNQEAVSKLLIFFRDCIIRKMQLMGTEKIISLFERDERKEVEGSICLPGSGIPEWFSYKNNGSSINIPGLRNDCGRSSYIMGFAVCLVFGFDFDIGFFKTVDVRYDFHIETRDGHKEGIFHKIHFFNMEMEKDEFSYSDHIFLGYILSSEYYELFQKLDTPLANCSMSDYVGTSFEFDVICDVICDPEFAYEEGKKDCKVKYCGIQPIYVQAQVMSIIQDTVGL